MCIRDRFNSLSIARRTIAKLVGMGRSSKSKPSARLEMAKDLHHVMGEQLKDEPDADSPGEEDDDEYESEGEFPR